MSFSTPTDGLQPDDKAVRSGNHQWLLRAFALVVSVVFLLMGQGASAQEAGTVSGSVVSTWDGTPLAGVTVTVKGTTLAAVTDAAGRFELKNVPPGDQELRFSKSGFASVTVTDARVLLGQTTTVDGNLRPEFYEMEEYEVTAEEFAEQTEKILLDRQNSSSMIEALGSDFLSRVGAGNAAESITKVAGATIVEGKFAVIRGLSDRYVSTTLNGANIPSADPYRQSASLDLFPAQVISKVVVSKNFTPDQPGAFTGGGIDIVTKSFPEKPFVSVTLGAAYNTQTSLKGNFLSYKGGDLDWAGMDDGSRAMPPGINQEVPINPTGQAIPAPSSGNITTNSRLRAGQLLLDKVTKEFGTTEFAPKRETAPLNHNFSGAGGDSVDFFAGRFGYFAGGSYKHDYTTYEDGTVGRYQSGTALKSSYRDARSLSTVNWSGMVNLAYQPIENHELGFLFFYNQNAVDDARVQDMGVEANSSGGPFRKFYLYWTERNLNTYQMKGKHVIPQANGLEFDWLVALTQTTQDEPDARFFNDVFEGGDYSTGGNGVPGPSKPTRYFRNLAEDNQNVKLDWTLPFPTWTDEDGQFKFGLFDSSSDRTFTERQFYYSGGGGYHGDPNQYLTTANLGAHPTTNAAQAINFHWDKVIQTFDSLYTGQSAVQAGYLMLDLPVINKLRLVGGARYETTDLRVHSESYLPSSVTGQKINDAMIVQNDLLPSAGLIFAIIPSMNIRLNYSQTVARPSFRELAAYYSYDPIISDFIEGNPLLKMTAVENYDVRWEWFPRPGEVVSASFFYKELQNAIERSNLKVDSEVISFENRAKAKLLGVEVEARKNLDFLGSLFKCFSVGGNVSLIESKTDLTSTELNTKRGFIPNIGSSRPLYDQSPYVINLDLNYNNTRSGTTASIIYNVVGPRITITKLNTDDVYEQPAPTLDVVVSQKIGKNVTLKLAGKNLFDPEIKRTYGKDTSLFYSSYKKGMTFSLALTCDF